MAVAQLRAGTLPPAVSEPFRMPPDPAALRPAPTTVALVTSQVRALLESTPSFHQLDADERRDLQANMVKVAAYAAECVRDDWLQSERLHQRPLVRYRETHEGPLVRAQDTFTPAATSQVGRITQETLKAIAFPTFVADLIKGTFEAITNSSLQQMEAYMRLLENVGKTVDQFMNDNISDDQARDWLAQRYPDHIQVSSRRAVARDGADQRPAPDFQADLNISSSVDISDDSGIEDTLVPAARRRMAQQRLQMLSTMVLMGMNRIVVTGGKIRATMLFHIDASDRLRQEHASDLDFRVGASGSFGFGPWQASASVSFAYVSSDRSTSSSDINVSADLTGEVEIHFKSDYMPLERFAASGQISQIQSNTAVPAANTPNLGENVPWGSSVQPPAPRPADQTPSSLPPIGSPLPAVRTPTAPTPPIVSARTSPTTPTTGSRPVAGTPSSSPSSPSGTPAASGGTPGATANPPAAGAPATANQPASGAPPATNPPASGSPAAGANPPAAGATPVGGNPAAPAPPAANQPATTGAH